MSFKAFTDYPVFDGTDDGNHNIKEVLVLSYDGDKYATVLYNNFESEVKVGYLWKNKELNKRFNPKMFMALPDHPEGEVLSRQKLQNLVKKRRLGTQYSISYEHSPYRFTKSLKKALEVVKVVSKDPSKEVILCRMTTRKTGFCYTPLLRVEGSKVLIYTDSSGHSQIKTQHLRKYKLI